MAAFRRFRCAVTRRLIYAIGLAVVVLMLPSIRGQSCQANAIVCENQLAGSPSSEWDVSGSGDSSLQGFATEISVNKGETVHFKVDTTAATFQIDIFRLGYYGGQGARRIATLSNITGRDQANCLTVGVNRPHRLRQLARVRVVGPCPRPPCPGSISRGCRVRAAARVTSSSSFATTRRRRTCCFRRPTRRGRRTTPTAATASTSAGPGPIPGAPTRSVTTGRSPRAAPAPEDWLFNAEYPMVRWLEANGYNVSYFTGVDTDRIGATELPRHRVFLSVGHDEYWSGRQRDQRRSGARRRRPSGLLQRERNLLENALGGERRRHQHAVSHAGQLQGNARQREDRSAVDDVDRHVARPAVVQPRRAKAGERVDRHDLHGELLHDQCGDPRHAGVRVATLLAQHAGRDAAGRREHDAHDGHARLRMGREPEQWFTPRRA